MKTILALLTFTMLGMTSGLALATPLYPDGYNQSTASLWTITDLQHSETAGFTLYFQGNSGRSDFGLFNVDDPSNPTALKGGLLQVFSYNEAPNFLAMTDASVKFRYNTDHWEASVNGVAPWTSFDPLFGFYFGVHTTSSPDIDYRYYSVSTLNDPDPGTSHISIAYNNNVNTAWIGLEALPFSKDPADFNDLMMVISDIEPIPEPASMILLGAGLLALAVYCKRRQNS